MSESNVFVQNMASVFYTKQGDKGTSRIGKTTAVSKANPVINVLGELDELNSFLGLVRTQKVSARSKKNIRQIQDDLFIIQAHIASLFMKGKQKISEFSSAKVSRLEKEIDSLERMVKPQRKFIIAGSNEASAWLDYVRAVTRRVERSFVRLCASREGHGVSWALVAYVNRMSSMLYALARYEAKRKGVREENPKYR